MNEYRELLLGCGHARDKRLGLPGDKLEWRGLVTLDHNTDTKPDIWCELDNTPWFPIGGYKFLKTVGDSYWEEYDESLIRLTSDFFDEVHAYEVLEHLGRQGDARAFFEHFSEIWRILKPGGHLFATVPSRYSAWLWGDPSHRRAILPESLVFLDQREYVKQCDGPVRTPMSDFRSIYKADFDIVASTDNHQQHLFCLKAIKPSRIGA